MKGGVRDNAGRKSLNEESKKKGYRVYLTKEEYESILGCGVGKSFSEKCGNLISKGIDASNNEKKSKCVTFIDLFAGLGGMRLGFETAFDNMGIETKCVFSSEIKKYAVDAYLKYFENEKVYGDITRIKASQIPDFDYLLAGFPCQPFSSAGKGRGFADTRGTLFFEIERILREKKPLGFLLENVEGLMMHDGGYTLNVILEHLKKLGYKVNYALLDSKEFGLAQSRKRVYIVGTKTDEIPLKNFMKKSSLFEDIMERRIETIDSEFTKSLLKNYDIKSLEGKSIKDKRGGKNNIHSWEIEIKGPTSNDQRRLLEALLKMRRRKKWAEEIGIDWMDGMPLTINQIRTFFDHEDLKRMLEDLVKKGYLTFEHPRMMKDRSRIPDTSKPKGYNIVAGKLSFEFSKILDSKGLVPTLVATDVMKLGVVDGTGLRRLTVREGQRLCGYPEEYDLSFLKEKEAFDLLGNTVCVPVIVEISKRLAELHQRL